MSALAQLRKQVDAQDQRRADERAKKESARRRDFLNEVERILGTDIVKELDFELDPDKYMAVLLHYRGHRYSVESRDTDRQHASLLPTKVVRWTHKVDKKVATFQAKRETVHANLPTDIANTWSLHALDSKRKEVSKYNLLDDPEVKAALDTREAELERAATEKEANEQATERGKIQELIAKANTATEHGDLWDLQNHRLRDRKDARAAINAARKRIEQAEAERKEKLAQAAQAAEDAFYPFRCYRVHYSIAVVDDDGGVYADTDSIYSATVEPDTGRFYHPLPDGRAHVMLKHVVKIEKLDIVAFSNMRDMFIGHAQTTEWGTIRVPPPECERLQPAPATVAGGESEEEETR